MPEVGYWTGIQNQRMTRRRALAATGSMATATALLAACGGGGQDGQTEVASITTKVEDSSKQAKRGGVYQQTRAMDVASWDPMINASWWSLTGGLVFARMTLIEPGHMKTSEGKVVGDAMESWEFSPDGLTLTFRLRPDVYFHPLPPVNGRQLDVDDVLFTWKRFEGMGVYRADFANSVNPNGPIQSVTAPDRQTIVMKLAFPVTTLPAQLANQFGGYPQLMPREADGGYDVRRHPISAGPFFLEEQTPSSNFVAKRHPRFHDAGRPYVDSVVTTIISEYAAGLSQFKAGHLHKFTVKAEDVLPTKAEVPELDLYQTPVAANGGGFFFGYRPNDKNPFRDVRVRQALSLALDRDLYIDVFYNVAKFKEQGIPVETRWNSAIAASFFEGWWLDPQSKEFGENAKYFQHNIAEGKKLMAAAGFANGVDVISNYPATQVNPKEVQVAQGMANDVGFRWTENVVDYNTVWNTDRFRYARGNFDGMGYKPIVGGDLDAVEHLRFVYSPKSSANFVGLDVNGKGDFSGDPYIDGELEKARKEIDVNKRKSIVHELQRYLGKQQYLVRAPGGASGLALLWPAVRNFQVFQGPSACYRNSAYEWLDDTKAPAGKT